MYPFWLYAVLLLILALVRICRLLFHSTKLILWNCHTHYFVQNIPFLLMSFPVLKSFIPGARILFEPEDNGKNAEDGSWTRVVAHFCFAAVWFAFGAWFLLGPGAGDSSKQNEDRREGDEGGKMG